MHSSDFLALDFPEQEYEGFRRFLISKSYSKTYIRDLENSIKSVYKNSKIEIDFTKKHSRYQDKAFRTVANYFSYIMKYPQEVELIREKIKPKSTGIDSFVPTDSLVKDTLDKLSSSDVFFSTYMTFLVSGIRVSEFEHLKQNHSSIKRIVHQNFVKYELNFERGKKSAYFLYCPLNVSESLEKTLNKVNLTLLQNYIQRNKLIPLKYCRKWFFSKCIELGIPEAIADFYEGRVSTSVGAKHYLSKQILADKFYAEKLIEFFEKFQSLMTINSR